MLINKSGTDQWSAGCGLFARGCVSCGQFFSVRERGFFNEKISSVVSGWRRGYPASYPGHFPFSGRLCPGLFCRSGFRSPDFRVADLWIVALAGLGLFVFNIEEEIMKESETNVISYQVRWPNGDRLGFLDVPGDCLQVLDSGVCVVRKDGISTAVVSGFCYIIPVFQDVAPANRELLEAVS